VRGLGAPGAVDTIRRKLDQHAQGVRNQASAAVGALGFGALQIGCDGLHPVPEAPRKVFNETAGEPWKSKGLPGRQAWAVRLIRDRGVSYAQASQDLNVQPTQPQR
jgi:hypothetical protein